MKTRGIFFLTVLAFLSIWAQAAIFQPQYAVFKGKSVRTTKVVGTTVTKNVTRYLIVDLTELDRTVTIDAAVVHGEKLFHITGTSSGVIAKISSGLPSAYTAVTMLRQSVSLSGSHYAVAAYKGESSTITIGALAPITFAAALKGKETDNFLNTSAKPATSGLNVWSCKLKIDSALTEQVSAVPGIDSAVAAVITSLTDGGYTETAADL